MDINKCECGFVFNRAGEEMNHKEEIASGGHVWVICPDCGKKGRK